MSARCPFLAALSLALAACAGATDEAPTSGTGSSTDAGVSWEAAQDTTDRVAIVTGFSGPEAVRFDAEQDVWFVSNFNGDGGERDGNGFVSRVSADGEVEVLRFMIGTDAAPFHAGRGMHITGDTLWVADVDGVHGFDRFSGESLAFIDFRALEPGFLNDIAVGPDGALYVTDTGASLVYRATGNGVTVAARIPEDGRPNGITWDPDGNRFLTVPWGGGQTLFAFAPGTDEVAPWSQATGGFFDGVERIGGRILIASQADSALHLVEGGTTRAYVRVAGRPADIGVDPIRSRVAVPYIDLDRVDLWQLP